MPRRVGFNRNLFLDWLDAAAAFAAETDDPRELRRRLEPLVARTIPSAENRRKAIDILINIWLKSNRLAPPLHREAVERFQAADAPADRLWLHYGLTLLAYPFFRDTAAAVGQLGRSGEPFTVTAIKQRLTASYGQIGSLGKAVERVLFSLRNWGLLVESEQHDGYRARIRGLAAGDRGLDAWLLACALRAHASKELPLQDLPRLPELFPFQFTITPAELHRDLRFVVERQGPAWESVRSAEMNGLP
jgi:hypothetical protein